MTPSSDTCLPVHHKYSSYRLCDLWVAECTTVTNCPCFSKKLLQHHNQIQLCHMLVNTWCFRSPFSVLF